MSKWILVITLLAVPVFAQRTRVDNMKAFRQELSAAVSGGSLTAEEKQKYESALKTMEAQRAARRAGARQTEWGSAEGHDVRERHRQVGDHGALHLIGLAADRLQGYGEQPGRPGYWREFVAPEAR